MNVARDKDRVADVHDVGVRPFRDGDYRHTVEIWNRAHPDLRSTVDEARYEEAHWDYGRYTRVRFVAEQDGAVVGFGRINHDPDEFHPDKYRLDVVVDPACRRRGIGAALYERLLAELRARGAIAVRAGVPWETEAQGIRFLTHRGFVEVRRGWQSRLDVTRADLARFAGAEVRVVSQGIVLTTLEAAQRRDPDVLQKVYELTMACEQDMPSDDPVTATTSARFLAFAIYAPNALSDAFFLATDAGRYVGLSALYRALAMPGVLHQGLTGVRREYRGKGIATALKVETVRYAQEHGYREIHTWNDERNQPMLHINLALGFVKQPAGVTFEKTL